MAPIQTYTKPQVDALIGLVLLASHTAAAAATISLASRNKNGYTGNLYQSDFDLYRHYIVQARPVSDAQALRHRCITGGSADGAAHYQFNTLASVQGGIGGGGGGDSTLVTSIDTLAMTNVAGYSTSYWLDIVNPLGSLFKQITTTLYKARLSSGDARRIGGWTHGYYESANVVTGLELSFASGNIDSIKVLSYGVRQ